MSDAPSLTPAAEARVAAYAAELAAHLPTRFAGRHACSCGWLSDRPTDRGGAVSLGRHLTDADRAATLRYELAVAEAAAADAAAVVAAL